jgi:hypothetical protein
MFKRIAVLALVAIFTACAQADPDQYKDTSGGPPVHGETNGVFYDATNDYLSFFVNDVEVGYIDSSGNITMDGSVAAQSLDPADDAATCFGTGDDFCLEFNAADAVPDCAYIGVGTESNQLVIGEVADTTGAAAADLAIAQQTNPTVIIHSADATDAADYLALAMDQTNCVVDCGQGALSMPDGITSSKTGGDVLTLTGNAPTITLVDNQSAALSIKSSGSATDFIVIDTTTDNEEVTLKCDTTKSCLRVDTGVATFDEQVVMTAGFSSAVTGADAITLTGNAPTITLADNKTAALSIKTSGTETDFIVIDTTTDNEEVTLIGRAAGVSTFRVDQGIAVFDEAAQLDAGFTSAVTGADAITLTGAAPTITLKDNEVAALSIKSSGTETDFIVIDTTTNNEEVTLVGRAAGVSTFRVDQGIAVFDEAVQMDAGFTSAVTSADAVTLTGAAPTITLKDNEAAALSIKTSGTGAAFIRIDTLTDNEVLELTGAAVATDVFHIDQGTMLVDETAAFTGGFTAGAPAILHQVIRFCGNGPTGGTETFLSPVPFDDTEADFIDGGAGCDGEDDPTIGTADEPWPQLKDAAFKPVAMVCTAICTAGTADDAIVFRMMDDTAAVTGMTCTTSALGGDATAAQCTVTDTSPATVAAGSLIAMGVDSADDDCNDAGDDFSCLVYVTF